MPPRNPRDDFSDLEQLVEKPRGLTEDKLPGHDFRSLKGEQVIVIAGATEYRGELLGASATEVVLKTTLRYVSIPFDRISSVKKVGASKGVFDPSKVVPRDFYGDWD